jgi:pseudouridine-5'-phosphate glycosidase
MTPSPIDIRPEVAAALISRRPVVALESTLLSHGLPYPTNIETGLAAENAIREAAALPATIAVLKGRPTVGLSRDEIHELSRSKNVWKASRRDLASAIIENRTAGTTVSATMFLAHRAGVQVFATGGIGGVHRRADSTWDVSADLAELARTPVAVVCAGAKSILDLPRTLELLETLGVPVVGYRTDEFPGFYTARTGLGVSARVDSPNQAAALLKAHWGLDGAGIVIAQPVPADVGLDQHELDAAIQEAEADAANAKVQGPDLTPFLLARLADITKGKTLDANKALVMANARLAGSIAAAM